MTCRVQYQFVDRSDSLANGWTENWYSNVGPASICLAAVTDPILIGSRLAILSNDYRLTQVRVQTVGNRSDSAQKVYAGGTGIGTFPPPSSDTFTGEQPWDGLLSKVVGTTGSTRQFILRGIPTGVLQDTFAIGTNPVWLTNFAAWVLRMTNPPTHTPPAFQLRHTTTPAPATIQILTAALANNGRQLAFTTFANLPVWAIRGAVIRVRGVTGADRCNHLWRIQDVTSTTSFLTYPMRRTAYGTPAGAIFADQVVYSYDLLNLIIPSRGANRKTGRPPAVLRGRAPARLT